LVVLAEYPGAMNLLGVLFGVVGGVFLFMSATKNSEGFGVAGMGLVMVAALVFVGAWSRGMSAKADEARRIWESGKRGRAKVIQISTRGGMNDNPGVDFVLDVTPEGQPTYCTSTWAIVNLLAIPRIQPGCEIEVRIDPQDPSKVAIDQTLTYL
jgi:hypothetical protein